MNEPIRYMKQQIAEGKHWYIAMLEAIGLWTVPRETYQGRYYPYLIAKEAFDFLLLCERLCKELTGLAPEEEISELLFGNPPVIISAHELKDIIGTEKYTALLNHFYGVKVEQSLQISVIMDIEKENHGTKHSTDLQDEVFQRIYGASEEDLLARFRKERDYPLNEVMTITEHNEFTYWLFKYRFTYCDSARVASDTKKALHLIEELQGTKAIPGCV